MVVYGDVFQFVVFVSVPRLRSPKKNIPIKFSATLTSNLNLIIFLKVTTAFSWLSSSPQAAFAKNNVQPLHRGWTKNICSFTAHRDFSVPTSVATTCVTDGSISVKQMAPICTAIFWRAGNAVWRIRLKTSTHPLKTLLLIFFKTWKKKSWL